MAENSETQKKLFENYWDVSLKILGIEELNEFFKYFKKHIRVQYLQKKKIFIIRI